MTKQRPRKFALGHTSDNDILIVLAAGGILKRGLKADYLHWENSPSVTVSRNHVLRMVREGLLRRTNLRENGGSVWGITDEGRKLGRLNKMGDYQP